MSDRNVFKCFNQFPVCFNYCQLHFLFPHIASRLRMSHIQSVTCCHWWAPFLDAILLFVPVFVLVDWDTGTTAEPSMFRIHARLCCYTRPPMGLRDTFSSFHPQRLPGRFDEGLCFICVCKKLRLESISSAFVYGHIEISTYASGFDNKAHVH